MDAQLIKNYPLSEDILKQIRNKSRIKNAPVSSTTNPRPDRSLLSSQTWLFKGINAIKVNFSDNKLKQVVVKLSANCKTLLYGKRKVDRTCWDKIRGQTKLPLSEIVEIIYGGNTTAFEKVDKGQVRIQAKKRESYRRVYEHYDARRTIQLKHPYEGNAIKMW